MVSLLDLPERLGSFEITGVLGEGGSAVVYAARDGNREVALKVLHPEIGLEPKEVDRFLDEADRMRRVQHRALVPVLRAGLLPGGRPYIAMPKLRGTTLATTLTEGPIPLERALTLFTELAEGVATLHDAGLVHRDIKPENVFHLVAEDRLVLLDLGIARETSSAPSTTTRAGMVRGTPAYMAPERFFGKPASVPSDVYELALVLYAMLTSKLPWDGDDPRARLDPKPPSERGVLLPVELTRSLITALSVQPEGRPTSVRALIDDLAESARRSSRVATAPTELSAATPVQAIPTLTSPRSPQEVTTGPRVMVVEPPPLTPQPLTSDAARRPTSAGALLAMGAGIALVGAVGGAYLVVSLTKGEATPTSAPAALPPDTTPTASGQTSSAPVPPSASAPSPAPSASADAAPSSSAPIPKPEPSVVPPPSGAPPPPGVPSTQAPAKPAGDAGKAAAACNQFVALMCNPSSGATPAECTAWKENATRWRATLPPDDAAKLCSDARQSSEKGLALRRASKPPP